MAVKFKDYYETLGVEREATQEEIQKAFRKLARKHHPDVSKAPDAEDRFKEINEAYEVLKNPETRKRYDALGENWKAGQEFRPPPGWENGTFRFETGNAGDLGDLGGFSDFFRSIFGGGLRGEAFGGAGRGRTDGHEFGWRQKGEDLEAPIEISLEEAHRGAKKSIQMQIPSAQPGGLRRPERKSFDVTIPAGVTDGARVRLSGQGGPGVGGAPAGDLYLRVRIRPHARFRVEGHDLRTEVALAPWEAALGCEVSMPTLEGSVTLKIPAGTQGGRTLRLRGRGLKKRKGGAGDLLATVKIAVPESLTDKERRLFEELARESSFRPRG